MYLDKQSHRNQFCKLQIVTPTVQYTSLPSELQSNSEKLVLQ